MTHAPPTIAHVLHRLDYAGAEVLAAALARQLRGEYRWLFLCLDAGGPLGDALQSEGFEVIVLNRKPGLDWRVARQMAQCCDENRIDLLHAHQYTPFFYAAVGRWLPGGGRRPRPRPRPRMLFTEHGRHYPDQRRLKRVLANQLLLRRGDAVTAVGQFVKDALVRNEGIAAGRIEVIHNGIDPQPFAQLDTPATRAQVRAELGLTPAQSVWLQVARFHPVKDHGTALRALAQVQRDWTQQGQPAPVLLLAGDGGERQRMEQLADELGVRAQVRFLGVRTDIPRLMAAADGFVLSSLSEGLSVTLLEAMASGLPIVATQVGGNGEAVLHERTGLLSGRGDHAMLATNWLRLARDADLRQTYGAAGRARLHEHFTQARMHGLYAQCYARLLHPR